MRVRTLEIRWHNSESNGSEPIYACDFQPLHAAQLKKLVTARQSSAGAKVAAQSAVGQSFRLVTGGGDNNVRVWMVHPNYMPAASVASTSTGPPPTPHPPRVEYLATLSRHSAAVNVVRFSPNGECIASAGDDGCIIIWTPSDRPVHQFGSETSDEQQYEKEHWRVRMSIHCSQREVYDLAWSPNGEWLLAGSTDNTARVYNASSGACVKEISEHSHYVQGVAWDPLNEYIATQSSDRSVHVHNISFRRDVASDTHTFECHAVGRNSRMPVKHHRSSSSSQDRDSGLSRPPMYRRSSAISEAESSVSEVREEFSPAFVQSSLHAFPGPLTPANSVPSTPSVMYPPLERSSSRRSSFTGSAGSPPPGRSHSSSRFGRSPSPMPPLPAIRAPPPTAQWAQMKLYGDESYTNFFRRLTFSPDGALLFTPAGQYEDLSLALKVASGAATSAKPDDPPVKPKRGATSGAEAGPKSSVYIYSRASFHRPPVAHLPGHKSASVAVKFSPLLYELRPGVTAPDPHPSPKAEPKKIHLQRGHDQVVDVDMGVMPDVAEAEVPVEGASNSTPPESASPEKKPADSTASATPASVWALPYRMMFAVATQDTVVIYDTQQAGPICMFANLHYASFTDIAWAPDGQSLMLASSDGYCSFVIFDDPVPLYHSQQHHLQLLSIANHHSAIPSNNTQPLSLPFPAPPAPSSAIPTNTLPQKRAQPPTPAESVDDAAGVLSMQLPDPAAEPPAKKKRRVELKHIGSLDSA